MRNLAEPCICKGKAHASVSMGRWILPYRWRNRVADHFYDSNVR
jgi:hypothetical protein